MDIKKIIDKKSKGKELSKEEISFFVNGYTNGKIADYQASALLMAIKILGMNEKETFYLTEAMLSSGLVMDLSDLGVTVDKHSTGGISDTTTIALVPICAVCGVKMLKLSGRSLGFTGGTIDKLEAFEGFDVNITMDKAKELVSKNEACIIGATKDLAPADKIIYALRDTTSTVESIPLIASSIMSKKLASGADVIVLDVKYGNGAFMKTKKDAVTLAKLMVKIGEYFGKKMAYCVGDMNEPLGYYIGSKLEAYEAIELLNGKTGKLRDVTIELASKCISLGLGASYDEAYQMATNAVDSKLALNKLKEIVKAQGGSTKLFKGLGLKPTLVVKSETTGILTKINCSQLGILTGEMGASRQKITDKIDYNIGLKTFHKLGQQINKGDVIFEIFAKDKSQALEYKQKFVDCYTIKENKNYEKDC